jgi:ABC-type bacteriocin/lantibiotic exporter with double-glycine peptidase domain
MCSGVELLGHAMFLVAGAWLVMEGRLSLGEMVALSALGVAFLVPAGALVALLGRWPSVRMRFERVRDLLEVEADLVGARSLPDAGVGLDIQLSHVHFRYQSAGAWAIDDVSVSIREKRLVVIAGRSGAGKSALAGLLAGLYRAESGQIAIAGVATDDVERGELRSRCGVVWADDALIAGSIRDNIIFHRADVTEEDVVQAAVMVELHDSVLDMPKGYDTPVFGAGGGLSGGQHHRLLLARALVRRPSVLVIDEVLGRLDAGWERRVLERLRSVRSLTTIVVSHRLTAAQHADLVLVLRDGRLIESGTHDQLVATAGFYARLAIEQGLVEGGEGVRASRGRVGGVRHVAES